MKIETFYNHIVYLDKQRKMLKKNKFFKFEDVILKIEKQIIDKDKSLCENCYFNIHQISCRGIPCNLNKRPYIYKELSDIERLILLGGDNGV